VEHLVEHANEDREARLQMLQEQKAEIEEKIQKLQSGAEFQVLDEHEIRSQLGYIAEFADSLITDFREADENFKEIIQSIYQKYGTASQKSEILRYVFDALSEIKASPQGKSFYAFWDFLNSDMQTKWEELIDSLSSSLEQKELPASVDFFA
jgi:hypothetical protein